MMNKLVISLLLFLPTATFAGGELGLVGFAEPFTGMKYVRDINGSWRYSNNKLSFGIYGFIELSDKDAIKISTQLLVDEEITGLKNKVQFMGDFSMLKVTYEYTCFFNPTVPANKYGYLMNKTAAHRFYIDIEVPVL